MENKIPISVFIKEELAKKNKTQYWLTQQAGLPSGFSSRLMKGSRGNRMSVKSALRIFKALEIPIEQLELIDWK